MKLVQSLIKFFESDCELFSDEEKNGILDFLCCQFGCKSLYDENILELIAND